eukprot:COSAG06_NODE_443_length_15706_cov_348.207022_4_plen_213_part_00
MRCGATRLKRPLRKPVRLLTARCRRRPCVCCCPSSRSAGTSHVHAGAGGADCLTLDRSAFNRLFGQTVLDEVANANEKVLKTASKVYGNNTTTTKLRLSFFFFFFFFFFLRCHDRMMRNDHLSRQARDKTHATLKTNPSFFFFFFFFFFFYFFFFYFSPRRCVLCRGEGGCRGDAAAAPLWRRSIPGVVQDGRVCWIRRLWIRPHRESTRLS